MKDENQKNPDQDQRNIYLIFQLASVLRRSYQDDQKNQNCNSQKNCTYGHLGMGQIFFCNTETICQILHIRSCKRCDTVEKKHTVYDSQKLEKYKEMKEKVNLQLTQMVK